MWLLGLILLPITFADHRQLKINNYYIDIAENTLKSIRTTETSPSTKLDLSSLGLRNIASNVFDDLKHLKNLSLANNSLSELPVYLFKNLKNLEHLSIADNEFQQIWNSFVGLDNLKTLNISNNPMSLLKEHWFYGLPKSSNILTLGNYFLTLSNALFEHPDSVGDVEFRREIKSEQTALEYKMALKYQAERNALLSSGAVLDKDLRAKICIHEGTVKSLEVLKSNETLPRDCELAGISHRDGDLILSSSGISSFESGWYRLQDWPVRKIELSYNKIVQVTRDLLNDLPKGLVHVSLANNRIERLERGIIDNKYLRTLDLSKNFIGEIEDSALKNTNLMKLSVVANRLQNIKFVATLPSTLTHLFLDDNQISEVPDRSFANLDRLESLRLSRNNIKEVTSHSLRGLFSLKKLSFLSNQIQKIEPGSFQDLQALLELNLQNNRLVNLEKGVHGDLRKIKKLDLSNNKFTKLTKNSFEGLSDTLEELNLEHNVLENLEAGTFMNVPKKSLLLRKNKISKIAQGSFDLPALEAMDLSHNFLTEIEGNSFQGVPKLRHLALSFNNITNIRKGAMKNLGSLTGLTIQGNPIKKLENGAFFGLRKVEECKIFLIYLPIEAIQGGIFEDV